MCARTRVLAMGATAGVDGGGMPIRRRVWHALLHARIHIRTSICTGMHPDEATEPIIDLCLRSRKPFAVVPCCVFPQQNQHRRLLDGTRVRSYEQFVAFLQAKDPEIRLARLPFEGRNLVLFHLGTTAHGSGHQRAAMAPCLVEGGQQ